MDEDDIIQFVAALPGVATMTASESNGAPEAAWGDTFFFYDPDGDTPASQRMPFATLVTQDYEGFDNQSNLNRPGVFRSEYWRRTQRVRGPDGTYPPADYLMHRAEFDYSAITG